MRPSACVLLCGYVVAARPSHGFLHNGFRLHAHCHRRSQAGLYALSIVLPVNLSRTRCSHTSCVMRMWNNGLSTAPKNERRILKLAGSALPTSRNSTPHATPHFFFVHPIIASVICPTGPHPPLRLARRPNWGHIGRGGGWTPPCGTQYTVLMPKRR